MRDRHKEFKKYLNALTDRDKIKLIRRIKKIYEKNNIKTCSQCGIGINNDKFIRADNCIFHIVCRYRALKEYIKDEEVTIESCQDDIESTRRELKEYEKDINESKKTINKIQAKIQLLGGKYSEEIVKEAL